MKLKENPRIEIMYNVVNMIIPCDMNQLHELQEIVSATGDIDPEKDYELILQPKRKKRSLDANAYFWTLVSKLGARLRKPDADIYRELIKDNGVFEIMPIRKDAVERWMRVWSSHGTGWICEDLGQSRKFPDYHNIKSYYGSSTYTAAEMSRLIDAAIFECRELGIPTEVPAEIERIKSLWH